MNLQPFINNNLIKLKVIPNSKKTELIIENNLLKLHLKAIPDKNKANQELIKFFKKHFNLKVEINFGLRSRNKTIKIL